MITILLVPFVQAIPMTISNQQNENNINSQTNPINQPKHLTVNLEESISMQTNDDRGNLKNDQVSDVSSSKKFVSLSDDLPINTVHIDQKIVSIVAKDSSILSTTTDKISNQERIRFNGRSIVVESMLQQQNENPIQSYKDIAYQTLDHIDKQLQIFIQPETIALKFAILQNNIHVIQDDLQTLAHDLTPTSNPILLVLLVPLSGYILIRAENEKLKIKNPTKFLSSFFIVILLSSTAVTPFSISGNYWWMAFADNETGNNQTISSSITNYTGIKIQNNTILQNNTSLAKNHASTRDSNQTISDNIAIQDNLTTLSLTNTINSIKLGNDTVTTNLSISDSVTATIQSPPGNLTSDLGLSDSVSAVLNSTGMNQAMKQTTLVPSVPLLPNVTQSFSFATNNGTKGETDTQNGALQLQGQGYLSQKVNTTDNLKALTISAWVQPDYTQGSSVFTVISKENQFDLTINNNINPKQTAQFSIYDGIKWDTVNSTRIIPQDSWTHLTATYNGTDIALYINGTFQSSLKLPSVLTLDNGHLTPVTPDHISSNSDVVIGAQLESVRNDVRNQFSGQIKNVNLYNTLLSQSQIYQLYQKDSGTNPIQTVSVHNVSSNSTVTDNLPLLDSIQTVTNSTSLNAVNFTSVNNTNTTSLQVVPTIQSTKTSYSLGDSPEFTFKIFKDSDLKKLKSIKQTIQQNGWTDKNSTISVSIVAPNGTEIPVTTKFSKLKEGLFDIKVSAKRFGKPGLYTIKTTLVKNGKTYTTQDQYAWGLVSLNTDRSIYRPNQTANMTIVVLDSQGHSVCDAQLTIGMISPNGTITTLSSGNGITPGECGLYNAQYTTSSQGNYTVNVSATSSGINTSFTTSFLVQSNIPFDIIRTAQSKIDPVDNPNLFNVKIDLTSYTNVKSVTIQEQVPSIFNITTDGMVLTVGDTKIISWNKNLTGNNTSVQYSYSVPLVFPQLYALGPAKIIYGNNTFSEARQWFVANDPPVSYNNGGSGAFTTSTGSTSVVINSNYKNNFLLVGIVSGGANNGIKYLNYTTGGQACNNAGTATTDIDSNTGSESIPTNNATSASGTNSTAITIRTSIYGVSIPSGTIGTLNVCVALKKLNTRSEIMALLLHGVNQTGGLGYAKTKYDPSSNAVTALNTRINSEPNSLVIGVAGQLKNSNMALGTGTKLIIASNGGAPQNMAWGMANATTGTGTSTVIGFTVTSNVAHALSVVELNGLNYTLPEPLSLSDSIHAYISQKTISDSLSLADSVATTKSVTTSLSESLPLFDTVSTVKTQSVSLSDSLSLADTITTVKSKTASLSDSLSLSDTIAAPKSIVQSTSDSLSLADPAVFALKAKITSLSDSISFSDAIGTTKSLLSSLSDSVSTSDTLAKAQSTTLALSDSLSLLDDISKQSAINKTDNLSIDSSSTTATNLKSDQELIENNQESVVIDQSKPELVITSNKTALDDIIIPSTVTNPSINYSKIQKTSGSTTSVLINNQPLTITKDTTGDTKPDVKVTIQSNTTASGTSWDASLVLPTVQSSSSISLPISSGETNTPQLAIQLGSSVPLSFDKPIRLLFVDQSGLKVGFFHSSQVTEITSICISDSTSGIPLGSNECKINVGQDLVVWTNHFTGFVTWSSSTSSSGTSTSSSSSTGSLGGGGATGVGPSGFAGTSGAGAGLSSGTFGGKLAPELKILSVSYDVCSANTVKIFVEYGDDNPSVILRSSISGIVQTQPASEQPYAIQNQNSTIQRLVYEAPINSKEISFGVLALQASGNDINSVGKTIDVTGCKDTIVYENEKAATQTIDLQAPQIFSVNYNIGNQTSMSSDTYGYTNSQPVTISAIVDAKTISKAELRFIIPGKTLGYTTIPMDSKPVQVSNTTYVVSATIPSEQLKTPAIEYWVNIQNSAQKTSDSDHYTLGVKPNYEIATSLDIDTKSNRAEGTTATPTAYLTNNGNEPLFGIVSLLVDGKVVDVSTPQVFAPGQDQIKFVWNTPILNQLTSHQVTAKAMIYDKSIDSHIHTVNTFSPTRTIAISNQDNIDTIDMGNKTVAYPSVLYSSFKDQDDMRYEVTSPDGTCVIGGEKSCLVHDSTFGLRGNLKTVTISDQVYRIRYSGPDSPLERFSITSVDPIVGKWKVEIVSQKDLIPHAKAASNVFLKIKYSAVQDQFIIEK